MKQAMESIKNEDLLDLAAKTVPSEDTRDQIV